MELESKGRTDPATSLDNTDERTHDLPGSKAPGLAFLAALFTGLFIFALVQKHQNAARLERFRSDPTCIAERSGEARAPGTGACSDETAEVVGRWIRSSRSSRSYKLALRTADGVVDSVQLGGSAARAAWESLPQGARVLGRRLDDPSAPHPHIVGVRAGSVNVPTMWNPVARDRSVTQALMFIAPASIVWLVAFVVSLRRRLARRKAQRVTMGVVGSFS